MRDMFSYPVLHQQKRTVQEETHLIFCFIRSCRTTGARRTPLSSARFETGLHGL